MIIETLLKRFWREALIVLLAIGFGLSVTKCSRVNDDNKLLSRVGDSLYTVAQYHRNKNGDLVGQIRTYEGTITQFKTYIEQLGFDKETLERQVGSLNRLVSHWKGQVESKDRVIITLRDTLLHVQQDTSSVNPDLVVVSGKTFQWRSRFLQLDGTIDLTTDRLSLGYSYNSEFSITAYRKPQGLFKPPILVTDIWFEDPNMKVREFKGFVVTQDKKPGFFKSPLGYMTVGFAGGLLVSKLAQ